MNGLYDIIKQVRKKVLKSLYKFRVFCYNIIYILINFTERVLTKWLWCATLKASRGNSLFLSYPEFNTGYNARDRCINGTVGYGRFCAINYPAHTGNIKRKDKKMTKTKRKILSMFLSLCMVVSCMVGFSITASAIYEASGLEKFIPVLDSEGNIASYDVSIKVNDDHKNYPRMARLLFSELSISQIKEKWSDIQTGWNYIEGDSPVRLEGSKINISEIGVDTEDISYNSPVSGGVNTLDFSFDAVPLDANKNYNVYFVLRYGEWGGRYTIYRIIGDSLGTLQQMKINYNRQSESGAYDITVINTHYISGKDLDVSKLGTIPTGYCLNTAKSSSNGKWNGTSDINIYYDIAVASVTDGSTTTNSSDFAAAVTAWNSAAFWDARRLYR